MSKLLNVLFTVELSRRLAGTGVTAAAARLWTLSEHLAPAVT